MVKPIYAKRIAELRNKLGLTQQQLADKLHISRGRLNNYEQGVREPDIEMLNIFAEFFDVTTDYLMGRSDTPAPPTITVNNEPTTQELEEFLRTSNVQFNGAPLDDKDKEELLEFLRYAWHKLRQKKE